MDALGNEVSSSPSKTMLPERAFSSPMMVRATVDFPEPDSPTSPSVPPAGMSKETPATAWICPTVRRSTGDRIGNEVCRSRTDKSGDSVDIGEDSFRVVAGGLVGAGAVGQLAEDGLDLSALFVGVPAAGAEGAARGQGQEVGRRTLDGDQAIARAVESGDGRHQTGGVRVAAVFVDLAERTGLDDASGVHQDHPVGHMRRRRRGRG